MTNDKRRSKVSLMFLVVAAILFTGISIMSQVQSKEKQDGLEVTILIFSGRPNPTFFITDEARLKEIESMIYKAAPVDDFSKNTVIPSRLGYAGIAVIRKGEPIVLDTVDNFAVYAGYIEVMDKSSDPKTISKRFFMDEANRLENYLLEQALAEKAIDEKIYDLINKDR